MFRPFKIVPSIHLIAAAPLAVLLASAWAQPSFADRPSPTSQPKPASQPVPKATDAAVVELATEPVNLAALGVRLYPPIGAGIENTTAGTKATAQVAAADGSWVILLSGARTVNARTTLEDAAKAALEQLTAKMTVIQTDTKNEYATASARLLTTAADPGGPGGPKLLINNGGLEREFKRFYVQMPGARESEQVVRGYCVTRLGPSQFLTFELVTNWTNYPNARRVYETVIAAAEIEDPTLMNADRASAVKAGVKVIEAVTPEVLTAIMSEGGANGERWERFYRPSPSGLDADATEVGYRRVTVKRGTRAEIESKRGAIAPEGLIVQLDARGLDRVKMLDGKVIEGRIIDSKSVFFMGNDRTEETWTVRNAIREGSEVLQITELGARTSLSMSIKLEGVATKIVKPVVPEEGYVSRVESYLLPRIIVKSGVMADLGFYAYQSDAEAVVLRRDTLSEDPASPGVLRLTTKLSEDRKPQIMLFTEKGEWLRTEMADGTVWEPISLERLVSLWRGKGLPMN